MNTKIDISSLDEATKNEIERLQKRCEELYHGVQESTTIKVDYMVNWTEGEECDTLDIGPHIPGIPFKLHWDNMENLMNELKTKVDAEIKNIIAFSDNIADQLGVDRTEFFDQYFAA